MKIGSIRAWLLAAIVAAIGLWFVVPSDVDAHLLAGAAGLRVEQGQAVTSIASGAVDCAGALDPVAHGACCGTSAFGCCAPCLFVPSEPAASAPGGAQIFAVAFAETAAGLPPARLKRPPRLIY